MRRAAGVALGGILLTLVAFTFDASPLYVPGVAFTLLGLTLPAWIVVGARGATVGRRLHADRVLEEQPLEATIVVRRGHLGLPGAQIDDPLAGAPVSVGDALSPICGSRTAKVHVVARFARRGLRSVPPPTLVVRDALGLARTTRPALTATQEVLVLPRTEPVRWSEHGPGERRHRSGAPAPSEPLAAVDVDGLRPYRPGTPASRIHWPALARGAGLLERRLQADGDARPLVVVDARGSGPGAHLDAAVRAAASLTLELARRGGCMLLLPGERRASTIDPDLAGWEAAHVRLALVEGGPGTPAPRVGGGARLGPVFYVAAQPLDRLPAAVAGVGRRGCALVLPRELGARMGARPSFEVAGCYGLGVRQRAGALTPDQAVAA